MRKLMSLALRNVMRNRRRTILSLLAIMIGVAAMLMFRGFVNGQRRMMLGGVVEGQIGAIQIHRAGYLENIQGLPLTLDMADSRELRQKILSVPGVTGVAPRLSFGAMLSMPDRPTGGREPTDDDKGKTAFFIATGIEPESERKVTPVSFDWVRDGRMFDAANGREFILTVDLARSLGMRTEPDPKGRLPEEQWPAILASDRDGVLNGEALVLSGTQVSAMPGERKVGFLPLTTAQRLLRMEGRVTEYAVSLEDLWHPSEIRDQLKAVLGPEYEVNAWEEVMPIVREVMGRQNFFLSVLGTIFIGVVLLVIVNSMLMNIFERVREIGTMLAVGMRRGQVVLLLMMEGAFLGLLGGALGVAAGWGIVMWLNQKGLQISPPGAAVPSLVRPFVPISTLFAAAALATVVATLATLWPAYRASSLRPVEALRSL